jgi:hypothetical protein
VSLYMAMHSDVVTARWSMTMNIPRIVTTNPMISDLPLNLSFPAVWAPEWVECGDRVEVTTVALYQSRSTRIPHNCYLSLYGSLYHCTLPTTMAPHCILHSTPRHQLLVSDVVGLGVSPCLSSVSPQSLLSLSS